MEFCYCLNIILIFFFSEIEDWIHLKQNRNGRDIVESEIERSLSLKCIMLILWQTIILSGRFLNLKIGRLYYQYATEFYIATLSRKCPLLTTMDIVRHIKWGLPAGNVVYQIHGNKSCSAAHFKYGAVLFCIICAWGYVLSDGAHKLKGEVITICYSLLINADRISGFWFL